MKLTRCDNHPERDAVKTFRVIPLPLGNRPLIYGTTLNGKTIDLCAECARHLPLGTPTTQ